MSQLVSSSLLIGGGGGLPMFNRSLATSAQSHFFRAAPCASSNIALSTYRSNQPTQGTGRKSPVLSPPPHYSSTARRRLHNGTAGCLATPRPSRRQLSSTSSGFFTSHRSTHAGSTSSLNTWASTSSAKVSELSRGTISASDHNWNDATQASIEKLKKRYAPRTDDPSITHLQPSHSILSKPLFKPLPPVSLRTLISSWRSLAKSRLTFLMVLTGMAGYALVPASLAASSSVTTLLALTAGMTLCSSSANSLNQFLEAPYDAQMLRTRGRPLPSRNVSHMHAFTFACVTGVSGTAILAGAVNPLSAVLGAANIVLYAGVYTPLKRLSIVNTWVGAVVGAIPPLMGWVASTGTLLQSTDLPAWILAGILFAWQFPHFNSLAHNVRADYAKGGYRMMSVLNPALNRRTGLRYAAALLPLCWALPFSGSAVLPIYAALSTLPNAVLLQAAWRFYRDGGEASARKCFFVSLWHLAAIMSLAMACKQDLWTGLQMRLSGGELTEEKKGQE